MECQVFVAPPPPETRMEATGEFCYPGLGYAGVNFAVPLTEAPAPCAQPKAACAPIIELKCKCKCKKHHHKKCEKHHHKEGCGHHKEGCGHHKEGCCHHKDKKQQGCCSGCGRQGKCGDCGKCRPCCRGGCQHGNRAYPDGWKVRETYF